jgi:hypothetical protein
LLSRKLRPGGYVSIALSRDYTAANTAAAAKIGLCVLRLCVENDG